MPAELTNESHDDSTSLSIEDHRVYRRIVGKMMYGSIVRPDLAYVVKELARKLATPTISDMQKARRVMRYVKGTMNLELQLTGHEAADPELGRAGID
eukprot:3864992-Heterocapsa_arctica.AAC.1